MFSSRKAHKSQTSDSSTTKVSHQANSVLDSKADTQAVDRAPVTDQAAAQDNVGQDDSNATTSSTNPVGIAPVIIGDEIQKLAFTGPYDARAPLGYLGNYAIQESLGEGGQGAVFKAKDPRQDRFVAIKIISGDHEVEERVSREAKRTGTDHTNLVRVYGYESASGYHFLVLEYIEGQTLQQVMAAGPIETRQAVQWVKQAAVALDAMHTRDIVHLDLHPKNIMIRKSDGEAVIIDLGLDRKPLEAGQQVALGETVRYVSPEHARGAAVDLRSDIYSLGVLLYRMLTRRLPHSGTDDEVRHRIVHMPVPLPRTYNPRIPRTLECIIMRCLEKDRELRYGSARQLLNDLTLWEEYKPTQARPLNRWQRVWLAVAYRNRLASLSMLFIGLLALISVIYAVNIRAESLRTAEAHHDTRLLLSNTLDAAAQYENISNGLSQELLRKSKPYYEKVLDVNQNIPNKLSEVAEANFALAFTLHALKDAAKAKDYSRAADASFKNLRVRGYHSDDELRLLAIYHMEHTFLADRLGQPLPNDASLADFDQAIAYATQLVERKPTRTEYSDLLANAFINLGSFHFKQGRYAAAIAAKQKGIDTLQPLTEQNVSLAEKCGYLEQDQALAHRLNRENSQAEEALGRSKKLMAMVPTIQQAIPRFEKLLSMGQRLVTEYGQEARPDVLKSAQQTLEESVRLCLSMLERPDMNEQNQPDWIERALRGLDVTVALQQKVKDPAFDRESIMNATDRLLAMLKDGRRADQVEQRLQTHSLRYRLNVVYGLPLLNDLEPIVTLAAGQYGYPINRILLAREYVLSDRLAEAFEQLKQLDLSQLNGDLQFDLACVYCLVAQKLTNSQTLQQTAQNCVADDMATKALELLSKPETFDTIRKIDFQSQLNGDLKWLLDNRSEDIQKIRTATGK